MILNLNSLIVVDKVHHPTTQEVRFLLAQSYMPAQDIHVLKNPLGRIWYSTQKLSTLVSPEWTFPPGRLKRF
jgi:hypothetical protein